MHAATAGWPRSVTADAFPRRRITVWPPRRITSPVVAGVPARAPRQRGYSIGRIYHCSPVSGERYYLRLLLTVIPGPQSFDDLYIVDGVRYPTYYAACIARGLAESDQEWFQCFDEAVLFTTGHGLRTLFLTGVRQQLIADPRAIWDRYKQYFCGDHDSLASCESHFEWLQAIVPCQGQSRPVEL